MLLPHIFLNIWPPVKISACIRTSVWLFSLSVWRTSLLMKTIVFKACDDWSPTILRMNINSWSTLLLHFIIYMYIIWHYISAGHKLPAQPIATTWSGFESKQNHVRLPAIWPSFQGQVSLQHDVFVMWSKMGHPFPLCTLVTHVKVAIQNAAL